MNTVTVRSPGAYASIQDRGRYGYRRMGVPWSGVLDARLMRLANRLVGNSANAPVIECYDGGQQFSAAAAPLRFAVAGDAVLEITDADGTRRFAAWRSGLLLPGASLRIVRMARGRIAMLAVGGLTVAPVMGSASTYARAALGGLSGHALAADDRIAVDSARPAPERELPRPPAPDAGPIRIITGPQADHFNDEALRRLLSSEYHVSAAADRMGIRLDGPPLTHRPGCGHEIISDATVPGAIQVPGNGLPIILLADAQTAGGYPKIATVASAELARLAAMQPGETLRFVTISAADGEQLARDREQTTLALLDSIRVLPETGIDLAALYDANLIDGAVNAFTDVVSRG
jgi:allophanate hydrolase